MNDLVTLADRYVSTDEANTMAAVIDECAIEYSLDPWLIAYMIELESGFHKDPRGYYKGALQLSRDYLKHFKSAGLDPKSWKAWIEYGCMMMRTSADKGYSIQKALRPWGVRSRAIRKYKLKRGSTKGWNQYSPP
jgi:hypothetical protein